MIVTHKLEGRINDLLTDNENLIEQLDKLNKDYASVQSSRFGGQVINPQYDKQRSKSAFEKPHISVQSSYKNISEDKTDQTPKMTNTRFEENSRGDNVGSYLLSKSDKIESSPATEHRRMHGLSTGMGMQEQKSTEFMQVMTSVLHDTESSHQPNPISIKEISPDEFFQAFKAQLNSLD